MLFTAMLVSPLPSLIGLDETEKQTRICGKVNA
jgi:hypothetical protein